MLRSLQRNIAIAAILLASCCAPARSLAQGISHSAASPHRAAKPGSTAPPAHAANTSAPMPNAAALKQRVLDNLKTMQAEQERYICRMTLVDEETDKHGNVKKGETKTYDMFFVNGIEVDELTAKNGKPLNAGQQKKESGRVQKEIVRDSDQKQVAKEQDENEKQLDILLRALRYTNGHRQKIDGRSTLCYDLSGDPSFHPKNAQETFLHNMTGTIQVDEATGQLVDLNARLDHAVKIGGGLVANIHKGFWLHVHQARQPDGVWINDLVEGKGDARAVLFLHPYFQFQQTIRDCRLTSVSTQTTGGIIVNPGNTNGQIP